MSTGEHASDGHTTPFTYRRIWLLGTGILAVQLAFAVYNAFLPLLYREFIGSRAVVGLLMGTDNLVGLLLIPVIGAWSDRSGARLGRRLPFIAVGIPAAALTLLAIPFAAALLWSLIIAEVLFTVAMHAYRGPMVALILDHTPSSRRSTASGIAQLLGNVGVLVSFAVLAPLYDVDTRLPFVLAAGVLLASLVVVSTTADRSPPYLDHAPADGTGPVSDTLAGLRRLLRPEHRGPLLALASLLTTYVGFAGLQAMFPIYGVETLGLTEGRSVALLTTFAGSFLVFALVAGMLGTRFGAVRVMLVGQLALAALFLVATMVRTPVGVGVILALGGAAWPLFGVPAIALIADLGGRGRLGFYIGLYYVFTMTGQMVGPFVLGSAMDLFGNPSMWVMAALVTLLGFVLLRAARRGLDTVTRP